MTGRLSRRSFSASQFNAGRAIGDLRVISCIQPVWAKQHVAKAIGWRCRQMQGCDVYVDAQAGVSRISGIEFQRGVKVSKGRAVVRKAEVICPEYERRMEFVDLVTACR